MIAPLASVETRVRPWRDPLAVAAGLRHRDGALALISDGGPLGRWSFVAAELQASGLDVGLVLISDPAMNAAIGGLFA